MRHEEDFGFRSSQYERPNQKWVCGRQAEGKACNRGPDGKGHCQVLFECEPFKEGDRWYCNRPFTSGGKCEQGPLADGQCCLSRPPCKPRLSQRSVRGRVVISAGLFGLLILAALVLGGSNNAFFSPGELTSAHANISACQDCHGETRLFADHDGARQSGLCADCHAFDQSPLQAHNLPRSNVSSSDQTLPGQHQCQTCHQEHDGESALNMAQAGQTCANCHTDVHSFPEQHPHFETVAARPLEQRLLGFNHARHKNKYFPDQDQTEFACAQCHQKVSSKPVDFVVNGFDESCSDCHQSDVTGEFFDAGLMLWSVPAIDPARLNRITWPEAAYDEEAFVSPVQVWLLNKLKDTPANLQAMVNFDLNPLDTEDFDASQKQQVEYYVRESQTLLTALTSGNNRPANEDPAINALLAQLDTEQMRTARSYWFDDQALPEDAPYYADLTEGGTFIRGLTLRYRPSGHADPLMKALIEDLLVDETNPVNDLLLKDLLSEEMAGQCGRCHQVSREAAAQGNIWRAEIPAVPLTHFDHKPHMAPLSDQTCTDCHRIDPDHTQSDFESLNANQCGTCHQKAKVGNDCLQCHQYHAHTNMNQ